MTNNREALFNNSDTLRSSGVSELTAIKLLNSFIGIMDDRIERHLSQETVPKVYTGKIVSMEFSNKYLVFQTQTTVDGTPQMTNLSEKIAKSITVNYNDDAVVTIGNHSVHTLTESDNGKYVKICTYDGVQYYFLHLM